MCNMRISSFRLLSVFLGYFVAQAKTYPIQGWPMYPQPPREYLDDEYYYSPKYYYDTPAISVPEMLGPVPYPLYDPLGHFVNNDEPKRMEELQSRLAALPIGQETWFESDTTPRWQANGDDDVNAAFLDNLILTQMAQDAQRRRENARAAFPNYEERNVEDEDVRELKALAGKPLYHVPKTVPKFDDDDDYPADDGFINWNGNKRSVTTSAPSTTATPGDKEVMVPQPTRNHAHHKAENNRNDKAYYETVAHFFANKSPKSNFQTGSAKPRRIEKRFVAGDSDLVQELRVLKHHIAT